MSEATGEQFGPAINISPTPKTEKKLIYPYQELKEHLGPQKYEAVIVFGEGPVKRVIFSDELTPEQKQQWDESNKNPRAQKELNFRVVDYKKTKLKDCFIIEDSATNTIDNIIRSINHAPETFFNKVTAPEIGLLGNDHQVERTAQLLKLFTGNEKGAHPISAQRDVLMPFASFRNKSGKKGFFPELLRYMTGEPTNADLQEKTRGEAVGREKLKKPEDMFWWLGFVGHSDVPEVFNVIMTKLKQPEWRLYAKKGFELLGLDFEHFAAVDFAKKPNEMARMKIGLEKILADG